MRRHWWKLVPIPVLAIAAGGMCTPAIATCGGADEAALRAVTACPEAVEALGADIDTRMFGLACGKSKTSGATGTASWDIGISGSRRHGRLNFGAQLVDDEWRVHRAVVSVDGREIDVMTCNGAAAAGPATTGPVSPSPSPSPTPGPSPWNDERPGSATAPLETPAPAAAEAPEPPLRPILELKGKVVRSTRSTVKRGARCKVALYLARPTRVTVRCAATQLYDGTGSATVLVNGDAKVATFSDSSTDDGTPKVHLAVSGGVGTMTIRDASFEVVAKF